MKRKKISEIYNSEFKNHNFVSIKNNIFKKNIIFMAFVYFEYKF